MEKMNSIYKINSISEAHKLLDLPGPLHSLVSLVNTTAITIGLNAIPSPHVLNFYKISYWAKLSGKIKYGQGYYDFDEGGLLFASPGQVIGNHPDSNGDTPGYVLLIHPDFFLGYPLIKKIKQYGFFSYAANEALHLSETERATVVAVFTMMEEELAGRIDDFSQDVLVSHIETLLSYVNRFYRRQFITRKPAGNHTLQKLEEITGNYFNSDASLREGLPSVQYLAEQLYISPGYLSDMLRSLTGQNAQQYIHEKLIEKAKEKLSATTLSVSEVAYELGFGHPQSFSKLFKTKTNLSPLEFRRSFQ